MSGQSDTTPTRQLMKKICVSYHAVKAGKNVNIDDLLKVVK